MVPRERPSISTRYVSVGENFSFVRLEAWSEVVCDSQRNRSVVVFNRGVAGEIGKEKESSL